MSNNINNSLKNLTNNFKNNIINNIKNNSNDDDLFNHPYVLLFIGVAALGMIYYVFSRYYTSGSIKKSYTFYGKDILDFEPVFEDNFDTAPECVNRCKRDFHCDGITFNRSTGKCTGTKNGHLREDDANYRAWVKTRIEDKGISEKAKVSDYISEETRIEGVKFPLPQGINNFSILFWLNLKDWYENFGYWIEFENLNHLDV